MQKYFITGTDTDIGKTFITRLFLAKAKLQQKTAIAIKPVACGTISTPAGIKNEDVAFMQNENSVILSDTQINPFLLQAPLSPHIAAAQENIILSAEAISQACEDAQQYTVDYLFCEGAGGWLVPINAQETMADVAIKLKMPIILVVGMRLGCLNHALLTVENILQHQLPLAGFVANQITATSQECLAENIATLTARIPAPLLGTIPYSINKDIHALAHLIQLPETNNRGS